MCALGMDMQSGAAGFRLEHQMTRWQELKCGVSIQTCGATGWSMSVVSCHVYREFVTIPFLSVTLGNVAGILAPCT